VHGTSVSVSVRFVLLEFYASFEESGLPVGTNWTVTLGNATESSSGASTTFVVPVGLYQYKVDAPTGYVAQPADGALNVTNRSVTQPVAFSLQPTSSGGSGNLWGLPGLEVVALVGALAAAIVIGVALAWKKARAGLLRGASILAPSRSSGDDSIGLRGQRGPGIARRAFALP